MLNYCYKFPVVKGIQAGKEYYIGMVPLKMISRLFLEELDSVLPEFRAQRKLNENRIPEIKNYILKNLDSYVFSALAASIDGDFKFTPCQHDDIGILEIEMSATILINDGQHRKAAIAAAILEDRKIEDETISVVFYQDRGLVRSQQMFTDLNKHAVKTSNSISELYDSRDALAVCTRTVINDISFLNEYVDKEKDNLGKYSSSLFTLNTFYNANKKIVKSRECSTELYEFIFYFWKLVSENMIPWNEIRKKEIRKRELREDYIATQAVIIQALGRVGGALYDEKIVDISKILKKLSQINWKRNAPDWKLRVIRSDGRIINNTDAIILASNVIKKNIGIKLTEDEIEREKKFAQNRL